MDAKLLCYYDALTVAILLLTRQELSVAQLIMLHDDSQVVRPVCSLTQPDAWFA